MVTTVIRGGLGNQLFQYASAFALAKRLDQPLTLDISFFPKQTLRGYKLDKLKLADHEVTSGEFDGFLKRVYKNKNINGLIRLSAFKTLPVKSGKYLIDHTGSFTPEFFSIEAENIFLNGYFQSEEYFSSARSELVGQLQPIYAPELEYVSTLESIRSSNAVAVHIRRGDTAAAKKQLTAYAYLLSIQYYERAISEIEKRIPNPQFFFFSDDIDWVKENIKVPVAYQFVSLHTEHPDIDEMMLMRNCKHIITANSTFSWWAAWLNENENAIRIVPDKAFGNDHMIPESWIRIKTE